MKLSKKRLKCLKTIKNDEKLAKYRQKRRKTVKIPTKISKNRPTRRKIVENRQKCRKVQKISETGKKKLKWIKTGKIPIKMSYN